MLTSAVEGSAAEFLPFFLPCSAFKLFAASRPDGSLFRPHVIARQQIAV